MSKAKRDPEMELKRRERIDRAFSHGMAVIIIILCVILAAGLIVLVGFYALPLLYLLGLSMSNESKLLAIGVSCFILLTIYASLNENRVKELKKIVESEDRSDG